MTEILIAIGAFIAAVAAAYFKGRGSVKTAQKLDDLKQEAKAHERLNKVAPAGDDDDSRKRLLDAARRLRR